MKKIVVILFSMLLLSGCKNKNSNLICEGNYTINGKNIKVEYIFTESNNVINNYDVKLVFDNKDDANEIYQIYKEADQINEVESDYELIDNYILYKNAKNLEKFSIDIDMTKEELNSYLSNNNYSCKVGE